MDAPPRRGDAVAGLRRARPPPCFATSALRRRLAPLLAPAAGLLALQVVLGALTVWQLLAAWTVTAHLVVGNSFNACLLLVALRLREVGEARRAGPAAPEATRAALLAAAALLLAQIVLGGLVSSSFAGMACPEWPRCNGGALVPFLRRPRRPASRPPLERGTCSSRASAPRPFSHGACPRSARSPARPSRSASCRSPSASPTCASHSPSRSRRSTRPAPPSSSSPSPPPSTRPLRRGLALPFRNSDARLPGLRADERRRGEPLPGGARREGAGLPRPGARRRGGGDAGAAAVPDAPAPREARRAGAPRAGAGRRERRRRGAARGLLPRLPQGATRRVARLRRARAPGRHA